MKKKIFSILLTLVLVLSFSLVTAVPAMAQPTDVWVDDDFTGATPDWGTTHFKVIQDGIDTVAVGGTVNVAAGIYSTATNGESFPITIDKSLTLSGDVGDITAGPGANAPVIDGNEVVGSAITIEGGVSDVIIEGFEITNYRNKLLLAPWLTGGTGSAIVAWDSIAINNVIIRDNYMHELGWNAVLVGNGGQVLHDNWLVENNVVVNSGAYGIELTNTQNSSVIGNVITGGPDVLEEPDWTSITAILLQAYSSSGDSPNQSYVTVTGNVITGPFDDAGINLLARARGTGEPILSNITVANNEVMTDAFIGLLVRSSSKVDPNIGTPEMNDILIEGNLFSGNADGVQIVDENGGTHSNISITENDIINSTSSGIHILSGTSADGIAVNYNNIEGNALYGINNEGIGPLDATNNWWGHASGPSGPGGRTNPDDVVIGKGDAVSDNVDWDPWLRRSVWTNPAGKDLPPSRR